MKLYNAPMPAPNPRRVRIFLAEKGPKAQAAVELINLDIMKGEIKTAEHFARNSLGQVPTLELNDGTFLSETVSICRYLEGEFPDPPLFGRSPKEQAFIDQWTRRVELRIGGPVRNFWMHAHPFTAGRDFCLVHNGSLSNPHLVRKRLEPLGIKFETDNDTEAACRFFEWRLREGDDLKTAVQRGFSELDGFFTFLMGTDSELLIVRDAFACKPAVVAETDDYVAIASEFRSLAHLPHISHATLFEPKPEEIYSWRI